jgi:CubicO group peptidase (beta-lactamase class C family)
MERRRRSVVFQVFVVAVSSAAALTGLFAQTARPDPRLAEIMAALKEGQPPAREAAAGALGRMGPAAAAAVEPLIATFADENLYLRGAAAIALGRIGQAAVPPLARALGDANAEVRRSAAIALGRVGTSAVAAVPALTRATADPDEDVRFAAVTALGGLGASARDAAPALTDALHDRSDPVRAAARLALARADPGGRVAARRLGALTATIDRLVPMLMAEDHVPGVSVALILDRQVAWSKAYGVKDSTSAAPAGRDTAFEAASMSKPIFGLLVLQLVESRRLDLDRPLVAYDDQLVVPDEPGRRLVTARMVLSHTSGYPNWRPGGEEREGPIPLLFTPGSRFSYSGEGVFYLQRVIERITGEPLDRWADSHLFRPLGLAHTGYAWTPAIESTLATGHRDTGAVLTKSKYTHPNAAYSLYTTADEYATLLVDVLKAERGESRLVSAASVRGALSHQVTLDSRDPIERPGDAQGTAVYWGLGWSINATAQGDIAHHSGSNSTGFRSFSQFSPTRGTGLVIFTNGTKGGDLWTRLVASIGDL